uniref:Uncharacterized protein n=1 Tax=Heliothis virescens TaxID=7102 RepID=A0A2A4JSX0_HELVI
MYCKNNVEAHARPDTGSPEWNGKEGQVEPYPEYHDSGYPDPENHEPANQEPGYQEPPSDHVAYEKLSALMTDFSKAMDEHLTPLMSKLAVPKQNEMKGIGLGGMASYLNYLYLLIQDLEHEKQEGTNSTSDDASKPRNNEIILQFDAPYPVDWPFIHDTATHEEPQAAK